MTTEAQNRTNRAIAANLLHHINTFVPTDSQASHNTAKRLAREYKATLAEIEDD